MIDLDTASPADVMARTICGEARGEGDEGMHAVANVIMNRANRPCWWGRNVKEVCLKPYQFSCWLVGDPNRTIILNLSSEFSIYNEALGLAEKAIAGELEDITRGATHYYAKGTPEPKWAEGLSPCAMIGRHIFFNLSQEA